MKLGVWAMVLTFGLIHCSYAQKVKNVTAEYQNEQVQINYDLVGELPGQVYRVALYGSLDNFVSPLIYVKGDVGNEIPVGRNKSIIWDVKQELVSFKGDITFEIKARLVSSPLAITKPDNGLSIRRGERLEIRWLGRMAGERVHLELYQNQAKVLSLGAVANKGAYNWTIPSGVKPGTDYSVRIKSSRSTKSTNSGNFAIKRKVPLAAKVIPFAVIVPIIAILLSKDGGGSTDDAILPPPPGAPD